MWQKGQEQIRKMRKRGGSVFVMSSRYQLVEGKPKEGRQVEGNTDETNRRFHMLGKIFSIPLFAQILKLG